MRGPQTKAKKPAAKAKAAPFHEHHYQFAADVRHMDDTVSIVLFCSCGSVIDHTVEPSVANLPEDEPEPDQPDEEEASNE